VYAGRVIKKDRYMADYKKMKKSYLYETVASQIEKMIIDKKLVIGEKLLPETTMAEEFGISRNILREALKILKERGLIELRSGDGIYVVEPEVTILKDMVKRFLSFENITKKNLFEFRLAIEIAACGLAAKNSSSDDIEIMENILKEMEAKYEDFKAWSNYELDFHLAVVKASGNPLFFTFLSPISNLLFDLFYKGRQSQKKEAIEEGIKGHRKIINAIKSKKRKGAEVAMLDHLERSARKTYNIKL